LYQGCRSVFPQTYCLFSGLNCALIPKMLANRAF
jgi:hypothetical protein